MEFLSISQVQALGCYTEEQEEMPELIEEAEAEDEAEAGAGEAEDEAKAEANEQLTKDPMEYIDHMFMVSGFVRLSEKESITKNAVSRMYSSRTGLCVSLKCGIAYKCCFLYDNKINYIYPATNELLEYVSMSDEDIGFADTYKLIDPSKIFPESFEIVVFKQDTKPLSKHTLNVFETTFLNYKNISVSASGSTIIITYAPVSSEENVISVESFVKFLNPSY